MAARAHGAAVLAMRGWSACLNFAESVWWLPVPESNNVKDIQKAAAEAAEAFRQTEDAVVGTNVLPEVVVYADEEEMFGMPGYIASMAEGLMVPPPQMVGYANFVNDEDICVDMSLWSFMKFLLVR
ncbi:putative transcription factor AP2-EREBP family [Helianthus annuus]|nr:putative transcription factor AP2-EREBP family [Helianthus annuus]